MDDDDYMMEPSWAFIVGVVVCAVLMMLLLWG